MITWRQFVYSVETQLMNDGIDLKKDIIEIEYIDFSGPSIRQPFDLNVKIVNIREMPGRVYIMIS